MRSLRSLGAPALGGAIALGCGGVAVVPPEGAGGAGGGSSGPATSTADPTLGCDPGQADCNGAAADGCEVDLASDAASCGACGHGCQGGKCQSGLCQPVIVATGQAYAVRLAATETAVYWTSNDGIVFRAHEGEAPAMVAVDQPNPGDIAVNSTHVYWANLGDGTIARAPLEGDGAEVVAEGAGHPWTLAVSDTRLAWTDYQTGDVTVMPLDGGAKVVVATSQGAWGLAMDATHVYWTTLFAQQVQRAPIAGGAAVMALPFGDDLPKTLADAGNPLLLVVRGDHVYFTDTYDKASDDEHVRRVPVAGGAMVNVSATLGAWGVAVDASRAYWTDPASDEVWSAPLADGLPEPMATSVVDPTDIEVDEEAVYVTAIEATYRIPLVGGPPEALVWGAGRGLAIDGERVFVGTADGRILAVPKHGGAALTLSKGDLPPSDIGVSDSHVYWILRDLSGSLLRTPK